MDDRDIIWLLATHPDAKGYLPWAEAEAAKQLPFAELESQLVLAYTKWHKKSAVTASGEMWDTDWLEMVCAKALAGFRAAKWGEVGSVGGVGGAGGGSGSGPKTRKRGYASSSDDDDDA
jgi:hypothetical protein